MVGEDIGICYTRTGRRFFSDAALETAFLDQLRAACDRCDLWTTLGSDWVCLDAELMPWSVKAQELLRNQYAGTGAATTAGLAETRRMLEAALSRGLPVTSILDRIHRRSDAVSRYVESYGCYCWEVHSLSDLRLAPFHVLASEGRVHTDKDYLWHMHLCHDLAAAGDCLVRATPFEVIDLGDPASQEHGIAWWESLVSAGGEGMVVKPVDFVARGLRGLVQPVVKCRGPEYLRIIYGPEYRLDENLDRLRGRSLGGKRSLTLREFALGLESLERFVRREPLRRIHECVFAVLALQSEPVDLRL